MRFQSHFHWACYFLSNIWGLAFEFLSLPNTLQLLQGESFNKFFGKISQNAKVKFCTLGKGTEKTKPPSDPHHHQHPHPHCHHHRYHQVSLTVTELPASAAGAGEGGAHRSWSVLPPLELANRCLPIFNHVSSCLIPPLELANRFSVFFSLLDFCVIKIVLISSWYLASVTWAPGPLLAVAWMPRHQVTETFLWGLFQTCDSNLFMRLLLFSNL